MLSDYDTTITEYDKVLNHLEFSKTKLYHPKIFNKVETNDKIETLTFI